MASAKPQEGSPIRVSPKPKHCKRWQNIFLDDSGFPDRSNEYDHMLHDIDGSPILRKLRHPMPDLNGPIDPRFNHPFIAKQHEALVCKKMDLSHLDPDLQEKIYSAIREYKSVFDEWGVFIPVKNCKCVIDTGNARPIAVNIILYGEHETVIMRKCISALAKVGHI